MSRKLIITVLAVGIPLVLIGVYLAVGMICAKKPLNAHQVEAAIIGKVDRVVDTDKQVTGAVLGIEAPGLGISIRHAAGEAWPGEPMTTDRAYHSASVGKFHTAATILVLVERGELSLSDRLGDLIDTDSLAGLLMLEGRDRLPELTLEQLLTHRSGLADHFEDKTRDSTPNTMELVADEPERTWTILSRLEYVRDHFDPVGEPGNNSHYADTNYDLLGLVVETVTGLDFDEARRILVIEPAKTAARAWPPADTDLQTVAVDAKIAQLWIGDSELSHAPSVSIDGPGGGLAVTLDGQIRFMNAVVQGDVLPSLTSFMPQDDNWGRFNQGMDYGYGLMAIRPGKLSPFMKGYPTAYGHSGLTGSFLYYIPEYEATIAGTFNTTKWGRSRHVVFILKVMDLLRRAAMEESRPVG